MDELILGSENIVRMSQYLIAQEIKAEIGAEQLFFEYRQLEKIITNIKRNRRERNGT